MVQHPFKAAFEDLKFTCSWNIYIYFSNSLKAVDFNLSDKCKRVHSSLSLPIPPAPSESSIAGSLTAMRGTGCILFGNRTSSSLGVTSPLCMTAECMNTILGAHTLAGMRTKGTKPPASSTPPARCSRAGSSALGQSFIPWGQWIITALRTRQGQLLNSYSDAVRIFHNKSLTGKKKPNKPANQTPQLTNPFSSSWCQSLPLRGTAWWAVHCLVCPPQAIACFHKHHDQKRKLCFFVILKQMLH